MEAKAGRREQRQTEAVRINLAGKGKWGRRNRQVKQQGEAGKGKQAGTQAAWQAGKCLGGSIKY
jgi:hypothetical protein